MSKKAKTWLTFALILVGLAALVTGWLTNVFSFTVAIGIAVMFWIGAIVVAFAVKEKETMKPMSKMVHNEGCRKTAQRR